MNSHAKADLNQLTNDVHVLTAPIRFVIDCIRTAIFVVLFIAAVPLVFAGLVAHYVITGQPLLDEDGVLALKVIFTFVIPFVLPMVYRIGQHILLYVRGKSVRVEPFLAIKPYVFQHWHICLITLGLMLAGALTNYAWWECMKTELDLGILVVYLTSPLLLLFVKKPDRLSATRNNVPSFPRVAKASREPRVW